MANLEVRGEEEWRKKKRRDGKKGMEEIEVANSGL